jgi:hypothetical protein
MDGILRDDNPIRFQSAGFLGWFYDLLEDSYSRFGEPLNDRQGFLDEVFGDDWDYEMENPHLVRGFFNGVLKVYWRYQQLTPLVDGWD